MSQKTSAIIASELIGPPSTVGQCALLLQQKGDGSLSMKLPAAQLLDVPTPSAALTFADDLLSFSSLEARNVDLVEYIHRRHFADGVIDFDAFFDAAAALWRKEITNKDMASGRLLAKMNESHDLLALFANRAGNGERDMDRYLVSAMLQHAASLKLDSAIALARAVGQQKPGEFSFHAFPNALAIWLRNYPEVAHELHRRMANLDDPIENMLARVAIESLRRSRIEDAVMLAKAHLESGSPADQVLGLWAYGNLLQDQDVSVASRLDMESAVLSAIADLEQGTVRNSAISSALNALSMTTAFDDVLKNLCLAENELAMQGVASALSIRQGSFESPERFFEWLYFVIPLSAASSSGLDFTLSRIVDAESATEVQTFLKEWTRRNAPDHPRSSVFADSFDSCLVALAKTPEKLAPLLTDWFADDDHRFAAEAAGAIRHLMACGVHEFKLDPRLLEAMGSDARLLVIRRILGHLFEPKLLLNLSLSLLGVAEETLPDVMRLLENVIIEEIGLDYAGTAITFLQERKGTESRAVVRQALEAWTEELDHRRRQYVELPDRDELKPPRHLRYRFELARRKAMARMNKSAAKDSLLSSIATQVHLKGGRRWFSHNHGQFSAPGELKTFSTSCELPLREVVDPVGYAIRGFNLRAAKRGDR